MSLSGPESSFIKGCKGTTNKGTTSTETLLLYENLVQTFFRLLKNVQLHSMDNQAVQQNLKQLVEFVGKSAPLNDGKVRLNFIGDSIFVCGRLLYAARNVYESANELGTILHGAGIHEICFANDLTEDDLDSFCRAFIISVVKGREGFLLRTQYAHIEASGLGSQTEESGEDEAEAGGHVTLQFFAKAVYEIQGIIDDESWEEDLDGSLLKRVSQTLVGVVLDDPRLAKSWMNCRLPQCAEAQQVLQSGVLSLLIASAFSTSRGALSQQAQSTLIAAMSAVMNRKNETSQNTALTLALGLRFGGLCEVSAERLVAAYCATKTEDSQATHSLQSQIIRMALCYVECLSSKGGEEGHSHLDALHAVTQLPNQDGLLLRSLVEAVGLYTPGTILELDGRSWGVVIDSGVTPPNLARPRVRLLADTRGNLVKTLKELDLSVGSGAGMKITAIVDPSSHEFHTAPILLSEEGS
jgi:hypothetical protein